MKIKYYQMTVHEETKQADVYIYGDITSWPYRESDTSSFTLAKELQNLPEDIEQINVYINSYGGEVGEGLAIRSALKRHKAKVVTYCDGFAASIASVVFMAGDERVMSNASLLFIHNAWSYCAGDSNQLKKTAEELEKITQQSVEAYMEHVNISEEQLKEYMDEEKWLEPSECLEMGFCTRIEGVENSDKASQSVRKTMLQKLMSKETVQKEPITETKTDEKKENKENKVVKMLEALIN